MRYSTDHKTKTRARLVEAARREFRENGFDSSSIDKLMKAAGLTRGGFYAHFESKEALVREVLELEPGLLKQIRSVPTDSGAEVANLFDAYLDPNTRDQLIYCPLVAHPMDAIRGGPQRASLYEKQIHELVGSLEEHTSEREAILVTVLAVGAAILSTATTGEFADRIEDVCREEIRRTLETPP